MSEIYDNGVNKSVINWVIRILEKPPSNSYKIRNSEK